MDRSVATLDLPRRGRRPSASVAAPCRETPTARAPLPARWILDGGLRSFRGDAPFIGRSAAALKLVAAVAVQAHAADLAGAPDAEPGSAQLPYRIAAGITGASQALIHAAKNFLCEQGLATVEGDGPGGTLRYTLRPDAPPRARGSIAYRPAPLPDARSFHRLSCKRLDNLHALKLYLLLCALGGDGTSAAWPGDAAITDLTRIPGSRIPAALACLEAAGLIAGAADRARAPGSLLPLQV